jgi:4a-hydroxytetrahydrobiopterin dehydratase
MTMERGPEDRFSPEEVESKLSSLTGWKYDPASGSITKTYTRKNFLDAAAFIQKAAEIAESQDHHPDVLLHAYKKLTFTLSTHSAGGVTQNDIDLANALDKAA